jgi:hypothetical protein
VRREDQFHQRLVHAECGRRHARADVGYVGELEQTLNGAVFAVRTVQDRKDHVDVEPGHERFRRVRRLVLRALDREDGFVARPCDEVHFSSAADLPGRFHARLLDHFRG